MFDSIDLVKTTYQSSITIYTVGNLINAYTLISKPLKTVCTIVAYIPSMRSSATSCISKWIDFLVHTGYKPYKYRVKEREITIS